MNQGIQEILKAKNLSCTAVRVALLDMLAKYPHSDAARLFDKVKNKISTTSIQAIYQNLNTLVENEIVREIKPRGEVSLYEMELNDNHHHIVCRKCREVFDTACKKVAPCLSPVDDHGFVVDEAEVIFWGVCSKCQ